MSISPIQNYTYSICFILVTPNMGSDTKAEDNQSGKYQVFQTLRIFLYIFVFSLSKFERRNINQA